MNDQTLHVGNVGQQGEYGKCIDEGISFLLATLDVESEDAYTGENEFIQNENVVENWEEEGVASGFEELSETISPDENQESGEGQSQEQGGNENSGDESGSGSGEENENLQPGTDEGNSGSGEDQSLLQPEGSEEEAGNAEATAEEISSETLGRVSGESKTFDLPLKIVEIVFCSLASGLVLIKFIIILLTKLK